MSVAQVQKSLPEPWMPHARDAPRMWRPLPREAADVLCMEGTGRDLPPRADEEVAILLPLAPLLATDGRGHGTRVEPGAVAVAAPGELHGLRACGEGRWTARGLLAAPELLAPARPDPSGAGAPLAGAVLHDPALAAELHAVFDDLGRPFAAGAAAPRLRAALLRLGLRLAAAPPAAPAPAPRHVGAVLRVRDYLRAHVDAPVSLDELAGVSGLSRFYLLRAFRREHGVSPHAYQMHLRLARARRLLAQGVAPSHAAYRAGFADQSHLTRRLKETTGFTPAEFARRFSVPARAAAASAA